MVDIGNLLPAEVVESDPITHLREALKKASHRRIRTKCKQMGLVWMGKNVVILGGPMEPFCVIQNDSNLELEGKNREINII